MMVFKLNIIVYSVNGRSIWETSRTIILVNSTIELIPSPGAFGFFKSLFGSSLFSLSIHLRLLLSCSHFTCLLVFYIIFLIISNVDQFVNAVNRLSIWEDLRPIFFVIGTIEIVPLSLFVSSNLRLLFSFNRGWISSHFFLILIFIVILNWFGYCISSHRVCTSLRMVFDLHIFILGDLLRRNILS